MECIISQVTDLGKWLAGWHGLECCKRPIIIAVVRASPGKGNQKSIESQKADIEDWARQHNASIEFLDLTGKEGGRVPKDLEIEIRRLMKEGGLLVCREQSRLYGGSKDASKLKWLRQRFKDRLRKLAGEWGIDQPLNVHFLTAETTAEIGRRKLKTAKNCGRPPKPEGIRRKILAMWYDGMSGESYRQIARHLSRSGYPCSKSFVAEVVREHRASTKVSPESC